MTSPSIVVVACLLAICSAKHRWERSTREHIFEWRTTECTVLHGEQTEPCPTPGPKGDWPCIRYSDLCNGLRDCPNGEDESPMQCHFHELHRAELDSIREQIQRMTLEFNRRKSATL
ncbi:hypothetical protein Q1695_004020 [Nippostrongylus brasiliensis]|nr:hypothetical protein Q1695_004020 [Nippostrongylus brasiliensis]